MRFKWTQSYQDQETLSHKYGKDYIIKDLYMTKKKYFQKYLSQPQLILKEDFQSLCLLFWL